MYTHGPGSNIVPRSLSAITAIAPGRPSEVRVVPSIGSTAMSIAGAEPSPISSPLNSIGASSFSPSPITTTPSIATRVEDDAHRLDGGAVGRDLVAAAHPAAARERGGLGGPHELHREVAIRALLSLHRFPSPPCRWSGDPSRAVGRREGPCTNGTVGACGRKRSHRRGGSRGKSRRKGCAGHGRGVGHRARVRRALRAGGRACRRPRRRRAERRHRRARRRARRVVPGGRRARRGRGRGRGERRGRGARTARRGGHRGRRRGRRCRRTCVDRDEWQRVLDINLTGTFLVCKHAIARDARAGRRSTASGAASSRSRASKGSKAPRAGARTTRRRAA